MVVAFLDVIAVVELKFIHTRRRPEIEAEKKKGASKGRLQQIEADKIGQFAGEDFPKS